ncbi:MAG: hypothetical protein Q8P20_08160 [bacterium]|nr:hypothetical protein [bacterium]
MKTITPQAEKLCEALRNRKIFCKTEVWDGHKHIDISIPWAKIDIEVDGLQHYTNAKQMISDFDRSYWSVQNDNYDTFHVPNTILDSHLEQVADALANAAREKYKQIQEEENTILGRIRKFFNIK